MKNFLFIIILMLGISINSISQTIVLLAKYGEITYNESWNDAEMVDLQEEEIILTFNGDTHIIEISNNFRDKFIYYTEESEKIIDETGHSLITFYYEVVDKNGSIFRAQCKTGKIKNGALKFKIKTSDGKSYNGDVDVFIVYNYERDKIYWIPIKEVPQGFTTNQGSFRVDPPKTRQPKIKYATNFEM